jgi:hypothetical protein
LPDVSRLSPRGLDAGEASAITKAFFVMPRLFEILDIQKNDRVIDMSSGAGFFASLMHDIGYDFQFHDGDGHAAQAGIGSGSDECRLLTLFATIDHFIDPQRDWEMVFSLNPEIVIGSATVFQEQGTDWDNLAPASGFRRFFYSPDTFSYIAAKYSRTAYRTGPYFILVRQPLEAAVLESVQHWNKAAFSAGESVFEQWFTAIAYANVVNLF